MKIYLLTIHKNQESSFFLEKEAIECAIDHILNDLYQLDIHDATEIFNLIKELKYNEAIEMYNNCINYPDNYINIYEYNVSSYENNIDERINNFEDFLKESVFK